MNYTIIGHTEDQSYHDRCGDFISKPGSFETQFFRDDNKAEFLKAWAHAKYHNTYEELIILLDGIPDGRLEDDEYDRYEDLEREMDPLYAEIHAKHEAAEAAKKEAAAQAALAKARQIAAEQRARDEAQLLALQKKLGLS
jgi:hypothetical protein